ncbi:MAG: nitroreductase [Bacillota bacterium]|nr:nitroreductase [Bacillota bacterium]NLL25968.1 diguanylate cyclase [Erysipelotrichia bacterium]
MNKTIKDLMERRSIRSFTDQQISKEDLETIVKAGMYAPSGMGRQSAIMLVIQDEETLETLRRLNCTAAGREYNRDNFFGAKTVIVVLADKNVRTHVYDGAVVMSNLMNAAHALNIGSCWIHRAKETFETEEGQQLLRKFGIEGDYEGIGNCILGYSAVDSPAPKPRKDNYVYWG